MISHNNALIPEYIYHYCPYDVAIEKIIPKCRLRFNRFIKLNDPKETNSLSILKSNWPGESEIHKQIRRQVINQWRVICFSCDNNELQSNDILLDNTYNYHTSPGYARPTMWAHYANNHEGVCLQINKEIFNKNVNAKYIAPDIVLHDKVKYSANILMGINPSIPTNIINKLLSGERVNIEKFIDEHKDYLFFYKYPS